MINRELIEVFSELAREKNVERSELGTILEQLFLYIIEKQNGTSDNCSVIVNIDKGEIEIYAEKEIVEQVTDPALEITLDEVLKKDPELSDLQIGDTYVEVVDPTIFGRRMIAHAKQFFNQRLRDVERKYIYEDYATRVGEIIIGVVHQVQRENVFINIEHAELRMPKKEQIPNEKYRRGDTIRAVIKSVEVTSKGPDIIVSRSDNHFLQKLFEMEVPEIEDGIIEIRAIARNPGERAKIIVHSQDRRVDAVGACVGMRGSRIQAIVRELNNEKIDIVNFSEQPEILITRALSPAKPIKLFIDDERKYCEAIFRDDELDSAIGKGAMNVSLASRVTGYFIKPFGEQEYESKQREQATRLDEIPDFPAAALNRLQDAGYQTITDVLQADEADLLSIKGIGDLTLEKIYDTIQSFVESNGSEDLESIETEEETA
ncbi:MAG: transcription termination factor NusA [Candidatus Neomarinimicrobiota bacterium]|nr:MAG: transcription termination factor NusA [Candidatus Neomarinimicrobiota bacterium]